MSILVIALLLAGLAVAAAVVLTVALRKLIGPEWLKRWTSGIQQFDGIRPIWNADRWEEYRRAGVGPSVLIGRECKALAAFEPAGAIWVGQVELGAERWSAEASAPVTPDSPLRVVAIAGLTVRVVADPTPDSRAPRI